MNLKRWFLSLFKKPCEAYCEYNVNNEVFYFYEGGGTIKRIKLDNILTEKIETKEEKRIHTFLLETALSAINKHYKNYEFVE